MSQSFKKWMMKGKNIEIWKFLEDVYIENMMEDAKHD